MSGYCANSNNNNSLSDTPTTNNIKKVKTKKTSNNSLYILENKSFFNKNYYNKYLNDGNNKFIKKFLIQENIDKNIIEKKLNIINNYLLNCYSFIKTNTEKNLIVFVNKYMDDERENEELINIKKEIKEIKNKKILKILEKYKFHFISKNFNKLKNCILKKSLNIHLTADLLNHIRETYFYVKVTNCFTSKRHSIKCFKSNKVNYFITTKIKDDWAKNKTLRKVLLIVYLIIEIIKLINFLLNKI